MDKPIQYNIYKGVKGKFGAIQFALQPAHHICSACKKRDFSGKGIAPCDCTDNQMQQKEGCIFIHASSATGPNQYDWDNKVIFALSIADISKILKSMKKSEDLSIYHDPGQQTSKQGEKTKTFQLKYYEGKGAVASLLEKQGENKKAHAIPLSHEELGILFVLLQSAIPKILGW